MFNSLFTLVKLPQNWKIVSCASQSSTSEATAFNRSLSTNYVEKYNFLQFLVLVGDIDLCTFFLRKHTVKIPFWLVRWRKLMWKDWMVTKTIQRRLRFANISMRMPVLKISLHQGRWPTTLTYCADRSFHWFALLGFETLLALLFFFERVLTKNSGFKDEVICNCHMAWQHLNSLGKKFFSVRRKVVPNLNQ